MKFNPDIHHRRSIRLQAYDYSGGGVYFITICVHGRECLFGIITNGLVQLNNAGESVKAIWNDLPQRFPTANLDDYVIMPNHFHGIINFVDGVGAIHELPKDVSPNIQTGATAELSIDLADATVVKANNRENTINERAIRELPLRPDPPAVDGPRRNMLLPKVMGYFKMNTAKKINLIRNTPGIPVWQRNYYERVIRNQEELELARNYILKNPVKWEMDKENPANMPVIPLAPKCPSVKSRSTA